MNSNSPSSTKGTVVSDQQAVGDCSSRWKRVRIGVIEAMRVLRPKLRYLELAHRLDRDTSGCLLMATKAFLRFAPCMRR